MSRFRLSVFTVLHFSFKIVRFITLKKKRVFFHHLCTPSKSHFFAFSIQIQFSDVSQLLVAFCLGSVKQAPIGSPNIHTGHWTSWRTECFCLFSFRFFFGVGVNRKILVGKPLNIIYHQQMQRADNAYMLCIVTLLLFYFWFYWILEPQQQQIV